MRRLTGRMKISERQNRLTLDLLIGHESAFRYSIGADRWLGSHHVDVRFISLKDRLYV